MSSVYVTIIIFLVVALVALAVVWWYAKRVKNELDDSPGIVAGARGGTSQTPEALEAAARALGRPVRRRTTLYGHP